MAMQGSPMPEPTVSDRLDRVGGGDRGQAPRDGFDADIGDRQAVDAAIVLLEPLDHLGVGSRPARALTQPERDLVALTEVAGVEAVAERISSACTPAALDAGALGAQLVEQRVALGGVDRRRVGATLPSGRGRCAPA